jgi:hypothetical protein
MCSHLEEIKHLRYFIGPGRKIKVMLECGHDVILYWPDDANPLGMLVECPLCRANCPECRNENSKNCEHKQKVVGDIPTV